MPKLVKHLTIFSLIASLAAASSFYWTRSGALLTLAVTFGTAAYHLGVRHLVGSIYDARMGDRADLTRSWYQPRPWEKRLYELLRVKRWKDRMPTYYPETFSPKLHTWEEIAQAMCQSELVHETNAVLSFVPLLFSRFFGSFYVFLLTSAAAAAFDLMLAMMQRYNRPRIMRLARRQRRDPPGAPR